MIHLRLTWWWQTQKGSTLWTAKRQTRASSPSPLTTTMSSRSASYPGCPPTCGAAGSPIAQDFLCANCDKSHWCNRHEIFLATKHGVEAKNYEGLGDAAKLKPLEVNYIQLFSCDDCSQNFEHWKKLEIAKRLAGLMLNCQVELKRLEDLSESIVQDFAHMRQREVGLVWALVFGLKSLISWTNLSTWCNAKG